MSIRTVKHELEAKLTGTGGGLFSKPSGRLERKSYGDGRERLKVSLRNLKVPTTSLALVTADAMEIAQVPVNDGTGLLDEETCDPDAFPALAAGQTIEVRVNGVLVLRGELRVD